MASTVRVRGIPEFDRAIEATVLRVNEASRKIVEDGGLLIASEAKRSFRGRPGGQRTSKTGNRYFSFKPPYQAVPPQPTNRTGHLSASIKIQSVQAIPGGWMSMTGPSMFYAPYVEYGTSRMRPEPFMDNTLERLKPRIEEIATAAWEEAVR